MLRAPCIDIGQVVCPHSCSLVRSPIHRRSPYYSGRPSSRSICRRTSCSHAARETSPPLSRRTLLKAAAVLSVAAGLLQGPPAALAIKGRKPPSGFRLYIDKLDGFSFFYPDTWTPVSSSGNEVFLRNPYNVNENLYVTISSPSSSKYTDSDLSSPDATAQTVLKQFLKEYMSTRLGVRREADIVDASLVTGADQKSYSQVQLSVVRKVRAKSYASRQQLAVSQQDRDRGMELEWDRRFISVLGIANKRLYQLRLQTADQSYERNKAVLDQIAQSFQVTEVEA